MKWLIAIFFVIVFVSAQSYNYDIDAAVKAAGQNIDSDLNVDVKVNSIEYNADGSVKVDVDTSVTGNVNGQAIDQKGNYNYQANANGSVSGTAKIDGKGYNISQVKIGTKINMSNGNNAEIRILPSTASATALARLKINCNNCTIELKEVGSQNNKSIAYEIQGTKEAKLLGLFKTNMKVKAQINAESGEVIGVNKPFWAFLASESEAEVN